MQVTLPTLTTGACELNDLHLLNVSLLLSSVCLTLMPPLVCFPWWALPFVLKMLIVSQLEILNHFIFFQKMEWKIVPSGFENKAASNPAGIVSPCLPKAIWKSYFFQKQQQQHVEETHNPEREINMKSYLCHLIVILLIKSNHLW